MSRSTRVSIRRRLCPALTGLSPSLAGLSRPFSFKHNFVTSRSCHDWIGIDPTTPVIQHSWARKYYRFRLFPFRSPLLRKSLRFLFLGLLRCFSSPSLILHPYFIQDEVIRYNPYWVPPSGHPRNNVSLQLTETYLSLPRPASTTSTKASTIAP